jgi:uncharacterized repeat protein (TIGR03803 family)
MIWLPPIARLQARTPSGKFQILSQDMAFIFRQGNESQRAKDSGHMGQVASHSHTKTRRPTHHAFNFCHDRRHGRASLRIRRKHGVCRKDHHGNSRLFLAPAATTAGYGEYNYGVVYRLTPNNGGWSQSVLHAFEGSTDGEVPRDGLIQDAGGTLYGTTAGFDDSYGNVFSLNTDGSNYSVLYNIPSCQSCYTGNGPWQTVTMDSSGALYGTTLADGENNDGEVFKLTPGQNNQWTATVLHASRAARNRNIPTRLF